MLAKAPGKVAAKEWLAVICAAWLLPTSLNANVLIDIPLADQFSDADVVMVATLGPGEFCSIGDEQRPCARLNPKAVFKRPANGVDIAQLRLVLHNGISEARIDTFDLDHDLLIFMNCYVGGHCSPVQGSRSVRTVSEPSLKQEK